MILKSFVIFIYNSVKSFSYYCQKETMFHFADGKRGASQWAFLCTTFLLLFGAIGVALAQQSNTGFNVSEGKPLLMPDDFEEMINVYWRVEEAEPDEENPLLEGDKPWDDGGVGIHGTVLQDPIDGLYKAWVVTTPAPEYFELGYRIHDNRRISYYESTDGVNWTRPKLPNSLWGDYEATNIVLNDVDEENIDQRYGSPREYLPSASQYASVNIYPEKEWAYEMFVYRGLYGGQHDREPGETDMFYLRSRDGKEWEEVHGPITAPFGGDVAFVYPASFIDPDKEEGYVAYYKGRTTHKGLDGPPYESSRGHSLRTVNRVESRDGKEWFNNEVVIIQDERDHQDTHHMELIPQRIPGGYIGIVGIYHPITQTLNLSLAASRDSKTWWFPDRRPTLDNSPLGEYGSGLIWQSKNLVDGGDRWYVYYAGSEGLHRPIFDTRAKEQLGADFLEVKIDEEIEVVNRYDPDNPVGSTYIQNRIEKMIDGRSQLPFNTALMRASWEKGRFYALVPAAGGPTLGIAVTKARDLGEGQLYVNFVTRPPKKNSKKPGFDEGYLQVELLDDQGNPIEDYTRKDSPKFRGDHNDMMIRWEGGNSIPQNASKIKFYLKRAFLYGFESRPEDG